MTCWCASPCGRGTATHGGPGSLTCSVPTRACASGPPATRSRSSPRRRSTSRCRPRRRSRRTWCIACAPGCAAPSRPPRSFPTAPGCRSPGRGRSTGRAGPGGGGGGDPAAYGEARTLSPAALKLKAGPAAWGPGTGSGGLPTPWERLRHRARNLHLRREAGPFLKWLSRRGLRLLLRSIRRSSR